MVSRPQVEKLDLGMSRSMSSSYLKKMQKMQNMQKMNAGGLVS